MVLEIPHGEIPKFQDIGDIPFVQLSKENDNLEGALRIPIFSNDPTLEEIADAINQKLDEKYWWFRKEWSEKGPPTERVDIKSGDKSFSVFNFGEVLTDDEISALRTMAGVFGQIPNEYAFTTILINNTDRINNYTGKNMFGQGFPEAKAFEVSPRARKEATFRDREGVSAFLGTIIHENAHSFVDNHYEVDIINSWIKEAGWKFDPQRGIKTEGGFPMSYFLDDPGESPTWYGAIAPNEDFCESFVASLLYPEELDPKRMEFLEKKFGIKKIDLTNFGEVELERKSFPDYELPRIDEVRFYLTNIPRMISSKTANN